MSKSTFLCGYTSRVSSHIFLFSYSTQSMSAFWCAFRWVSPFTTSATTVFSYMASRIYVAKILSQSSPKISSLTWMWNMCSMVLNPFEFKPPGGQSGMDYSNHSMFPSEQFDLNPVLDSKFVLRMMSYLMLSLSKTKTNKSLMHLFYQTRAISSLALWWLCAF